MQKKYDKEFKVMVCELMLSGQSAISVATDYGIDVSTVRKWKKQYQSGREAFTGSGRPSLTPEEKQIRELKKRLQETEMERDILKKALGIFSKNDRTFTG